MTSEQSRPFTKKGDAWSQSTNRYYASSVSNVPQDVSDEEALSGAWKRSNTPPKTVQELDMERVWELRRGIAADIWKTERLENEVAHKQIQLKEMKQALLYDAEHVDSEIVDYGVHIAVDLHKVRRAKELLERWVNEARTSRQEQEQEEKEAATSSSHQPDERQQQQRRQ